MLYRKIVVFFGASGFVGRFFIRHANNQLSQSRLSQVFDDDRDHDRDNDENRQ